MKFKSTANKPNIYELIDMDIADLMILQNYLISIDKSFERVFNAVEFFWSGETILFFTTKINSIKRDTWDCIIVTHETIPAKKQWAQYIKRVQ